MVGDSQEASDASLACGSDSHSQSKSFISIDVDKVLLEAQNRAKKATQATSVILVSGMTNETFATQYCALTGTSITIIGSTSLTMRLILPSCQGNSTATSFLTSLAHLILEDISFLPTTLTSISAANTIFAAASPYSEGFDTSGNLNWTAIFTRFPALTQLSLDSAVIRGTAPTALGSLVSQFICSNCGLTGTISSSLFSSCCPSGGQVCQFTLAGNRLTGGIPDDLFTPLHGKTFLASMTISFASNQLSGSIPTTMLSDLASVISPTLYLEMQSNQLTSIPDTFPTMSFRVLKFNASSNLLSSAVPSLANVTPQRSFAFDMSSNQLAGQLPARLFGAWTNTVSNDLLTVSFANNSITGSIPSGFIASSFSSVNVTLTTGLSVSLASNRLTGSIPSDMIRAINIQKVGVISNGILSFDVSGNQLDGSIPSNLFEGIFPTSGTTFTTASVNVSHNSLAGTLPADLLTGIPTSATAVTIDASDNILSGSPPAFCWNSTTLSLNMSLNNLVGTIPTEWTPSCALKSLDLSNNANLAGSIPSSLLSSSIVSLYASHTGLTGILPQILPLSLKALDLGFTNVSFCSSSDAITSLESYTGYCSLPCTEAYDCQANYTMCDTTSCAVPPVATPLTSPVSSPTPFGCPANTRPSLDFVCINGVWTAQSVNTTTLVIPSGAGNVIVTGNVTSTSIVISGTGTTITIDGCATNLTNIVVEIDAEEIAKLGSKLVQELLNLKNGQNCTDLSNVGVSALVKGSSCKKVKANKVFSGNTLSAAFTVDTSGCNTWWIILVSVVCGVVVIGVIAAVVAIMLVKKHKKKTTSHHLRQANIGS